ncbi:MAG: ABC-F family ATP-binding cassette domain-containing protein [Anaerolineaceae bacterium]|nr:MAG: ABC-F family ATP-binding cassette domain-containing protein [Anaerolineaceae bacterium]
MSLITATDLVKSYGAQDVFKGVSVAIPRQARIALVGPNGVGKTTLLRLLAGLEKPDEGRIQKARRLRIGYLPQEVSYSRSRKDELKRTVWDSCLDAFGEIRAQEAELARLERLMADPSEAEKAIARYGPIQEAFEHAGGYTYPSRIRQVLNGLGFTPDEYGRPLEQFSGGERTRALLARLLLEEPDLLILDEPTNHLDIAAIEWLESWLRDWPGAEVLVSHDRFLLDRLVDTVWELKPQGVELYRGNYSAYAQQRTERQEQHAARYRAQQEHVQREQEYIRRNIAGQNTRQAQGRRKRLERLLRDEGIARPVKERAVSIDFGQVDRSGDHVIETHDLVIGHRDSDQPLFGVPDLLLTRGECVALIGPNGAGKTTFLKTLLGDVQPWAGEVKLGASLQVGYFAQAHEDLNPEQTVLEEILSVAPRMKVSQARDWLARFLFVGDSVYKPIEILSGGERGRVALAKLALEGANLLLLDEPTNHLDIPSQEILEEALNGFPGTILLVSHDRYLINALATQVWAITRQARMLEVFTGGYETYLESQRLRTEARKVVSKKVSKRDRTSKDSRVGVRLTEVEERIETLEEALTEVTRQLEEAGNDVEQLHRLGDRYTELEADLERQIAIWERLARGEALA